jgi:hypothetical protein
MDFPLLPPWNGLAGTPGNDDPGNHCPEAIAKNDRGSIEYDAGECRKGRS